MEITFLNGIADSNRTIICHNRKSDECLIFKNIGYLFQERLPGKKDDWNFTIKSDNYEPIYNIVLGTRFINLDFKARNSEIGKSSGNVNGHEFVDLSLPSGRKWSTCNLGASTPFENGDYFAWGETSPKKLFEEGNYKYAHKIKNSLIDRLKTGEKFKKDFHYKDLNKLENTSDAASIIWGYPWMIPSKADFEELIKNCIWKLVIIHGKKGYNIIGSNGQSIFLPMTGYYTGETLVNRDLGYYWSSCKDNDIRNASILSFDAFNHSMEAYGKKYGIVIRPVFDGRSL